MPLGLDTPSTFGTVFLIIGPAYKEALGRGLGAETAARHAWFLGITMLLASGIFKIACAPFSGWIRKSVPRAGLLGSLAAIALVLISFLPLLDIAAHPVAGVVAMGLILGDADGEVGVSARVSRGAGGGAGRLCGLLRSFFRWAGDPGLAARGACPRTRSERCCRCRSTSGSPGSTTSGSDALRYLPVAIPLALATVVGGIDCTESAASAGDEYPTGQIIAAEGFATLVGGLFGGVIQSTPYIGHPAYKAMGARSAYTLATALFVGAAGIFGYFDWIFFFIPKAVVFPILIFVGLEITAQSFHATPVRHYPAVALACVPALAYLAVLAYKQLLPELRPFEHMQPASQHWIQTVTVIAGGGGFIITSLLWATAAGAHDRRPDPPPGRDALDRGCFLVVRHHSFPARGQSDPASGGRGCQAQGPGARGSQFPADTLSLGRCVCADGYGARLAVPLREDTAPRGGKSGAEIPGVKTALE